MRPWRCRGCGSEVLASMQGVWRGEACRGPSSSAPPPCLVASCLAPALRASSVRREDGGTHPSPWALPRLQEMGSSSRRLAAPWGPQGREAVGQGGDGLPPAQSLCTQRLQGPPASSGASRAPRSCPASPQPIRALQGCTCSSLPHPIAAHHPSLPANPTRRQGEKQSVFSPASQSAAGSPPGKQRGAARDWRAGRSEQGFPQPMGCCGAGCRGNGALPPPRGGRRRRPRWRRGGRDGTGGTGARRAAAGGRRRCWDGRPGCRRRCPAGSRASRRACGADAVTPKQPPPPRGEALGVPTPSPRPPPPPRRCPLTGRPPAPRPAASSPGSWRWRCWRGCSPTWARRG